MNIFTSKKSWGGTDPIWHRNDVGNLVRSVSYLPWEIPVFFLLSRNLSLFSNPIQWYQGERDLKATRKFCDLGWCDCDCFFPRNLQQDLLNGLLNLSIQYLHQLTVRRSPLVRSHSMFDGFWGMQRVVCYGAMSETLYLPVGWCELWWANEFVDDDLCPQWEMTSKWAII